MTIRADMNAIRAAEPTAVSVFGQFAFSAKCSRRVRQEWRLIPIGLRGKVLRVLVVYLGRQLK